MKLSASDIGREAKRIREYADRIRNLPEKASLGDLFTKQFMNNHSKFDSLNDLFTYCGIVVKNAEDLQIVRDGKFDSEISANTDFGSWHEMEQAAINAYIARKAKG